MSDPVFPEHPHPAGNERPAGHDGRRLDPGRGGHSERDRFLYHLRKGDRGDHSRRRVCPLKYGV